MINSMDTRLFLIGGSSGFIGTALCRHLQQSGIRYKRLVRYQAQAADEIFWDPQQGQLDPQQLEQVTHVINLAGAPVADAVWTRRRKQLLYDSRIDSARLLCQRLQTAGRGNCRIISTSGVGYYPCSDELFDEAAAPGEGFLTDVCRDWEATFAGTNHACLRLGVVLGPDGGALQKMLPPLRFGFGGHLGNGRQWMSWISRRDVIAALLFLAGHEEIQGPVNGVSPEPIRNHDFLQTLARVLNKPFWAHVPAWVLRLRFGEMARALLLCSNRVCPSVLHKHGFSFQDSDLESCFESIMKAADDA